jgi:hypothetical protein
MKQNTIRVVYRRAAATLAMKGASPIEFGSTSAQRPIASAYEIGYAAAGIKCPLTVV